MRASTLARMMKGRLLGEDVLFSSIKPLNCATPADTSVVLWPKDVRMAKKSLAGCVITSADVAADHADQMPMSLIACESLDEAFFLLEALVLGGELLCSAQDVVGKHIEVDARVHRTAVIGRAHVGHRSIIGAQAVIEDGVFIGDDCMIGAGSVVGGQAFVPYGKNPSIMLPSFGSVVIENGVSIGALCTIDRGLLGQTRIGRKSLIDSHIHVGHDVSLGSNVVVAALSGFAGFANIGNGVTFGGQVGVAPHVVIGDGARISGKTAVHCDIKPYELWSGNPAMPHAVYLRAHGAVKRKYRGFDDTKKAALRRHQKNPTPSVPVSSG